jgi:hypothetical protein
MVVMNRMMAACFQLGRRKPRILVLYCELVVLVIQQTIDRVQTKSKETPTRHKCVSKSKDREILGR